MCFRTNRPCRLVPAHRGRKMRPGHWKCLGVVGATRPPPLDSRFRGNDEAGGRNDENTEWRGSLAHSKTA